MLRRRPTTHAAPHHVARSSFDRITVHAVMLAATVTAAVVVAQGPAAALRHVADALAADLAALRDLPAPDEAAWRGQMVF